MLFEDRRTKRHRAEARPDVERVVRQAHGSVGERLAEPLAAEHAPYELTVDLGASTVTDASRLNAAFEIDDFRRMCLMGGLDRIDLTLRHEDEISAYERAKWG